MCMILKKGSTTIPLPKHPIKQASYTTMFTDNAKEIAKEQDFITLKNNSWNNTHNYSTPKT